MPFNAKCFLFLVHYGKVLCSHMSCQYEANIADSKTDHHAGKGSRTCAYCQHLQFQIWHSALGNLMSTAYPGPHRAERSEMIEAELLCQRSPVAVAPPRPHISGVLASWKTSIDSAWCCRERENIPQCLDRHRYMIRTTLKWPVYQISLLTLKVLIDSTYAWVKVSTKPTFA